MSTIRFGNLNREDERMLQEITQQISDARLEGKNNIVYPITQVRFSRLYLNILALNATPEFVPASGNRSSNMKLKF